MRALHERGHRITFYEPDAFDRQKHRDIADPPWAKVVVYPAQSEDDVLRTVEQSRGEHDYVAPRQIPGYGMYLSFTGGPMLKRLEREFGSPCARVLYSSVDPALYFPQRLPKRWDLGYMGTYSDDRQPGVERLLIEPARHAPQSRFVVAGPQYPDTIAWPANVDYKPHLAPGEHRAFYNSQRWTLNITRADMIAAGWSPSVRLFEAAACNTPNAPPDRRWLSSSIRSRAIRRTGGWRTMRGARRCCDRPGCVWSPGLRRRFMCASRTRAIRGRRRSWMKC